MFETLGSWLTGDLSPGARIWTAAAPALLLLAYVLVGMVAFVIRNARNGPFRDPEIESHGASLLIGMWLRQYFTWLVRPMFGLLVRSKLPANAITTLALLLAIAAAVALAAGRLALGGWLYVGAGLCDFFDGRLARLRNGASADGAMLDSVLDRYTEAVVFCGLAWFYRDSWVQVAVLLGLVGSMLVPYVRARGESLGVPLGNVGIVQRPERVVILGFALGLSPIVEAIVVPHEPHPIHRVAVVAIVLLAGATHISTLQRLIYARRRLGGEPRRRRLLGRGGLLRNVVSSGAATGSDFALVTLLVGLSASVPVATFFGCALGGLIHFSINRVWVFRTDAPTGRSVARYMLVTTSSAMLNAGLVAVLLLLPDIPYQAAWALTRIAVFVTWNHPLNRDYVFGGRVQRSAEAA